MKVSEIEKERNNLVVKSNDIIRKARYTLSLQQQKLILYTISKIKPNDTDFTFYDFALADVCEVMGIEKHHENYDDFKAGIKKLSDKSFWLTVNGEEKLCRWFTDVRVNKENNTVKLRFDNDLKPFLLELKKNYTAFKLEYAVTMKSKYSIRLYELLKSYAYVCYFEVTLEKLREVMLIEAYPDWRELKRNVIDKAVKDIKAFSDIDIEYETVKTGKAVTGLSFHIEKKDYAGKIKADVERGKRLGKKKNNIVKV